MRFGKMWKQGRQNLLRWYAGQKRDLPWRQHRGFSRDAILYRVWVSEIMLQQTTVAAVVPYFERFMARFPTVRELAEAPDTEVLRLWAGLGYYSRARNLKRAAESVVQAGAFPITVAEWRELPGVGPYTAGAVCSIALGMPAALVDGNVERVLSRLFRIQDRTPRKTKIWQAAQAEVDAIVAEGGDPGDFNQALMELGATICRPENPGCGVCPLAKVCGVGSGVAAARPGEWKVYPVRKARRAMVILKDHRVVFQNHKGEIFLVVQDGKGPMRWLKGFWDLPEGKKRPSSNSAVGLSVSTTITHHKIQRTLIFAKPGTKPPGTKKGRWVALEEVLSPAYSTLPVGAAARKSLQAIARSKLLRPMARL